MTFNMNRAWPMAQQIIVWRCFGDSTFVYGCVLRFPNICLRSALSLIGLICNACPSILSPVSSGGIWPYLFSNRDSVAIDSSPTFLFDALSYYNVSCISHISWTTISAMPWFDDANHCCLSVLDFTFVSIFQCFFTISPMFCAIVQCTHLGYVLRAILRTSILSGFLFPVTCVRGAWFDCSALYLYV